MRTLKTILFISTSFVPVISSAVDFELGNESDNEQDHGSANEQSNLPSDSAVGTI